MSSAGRLAGNVAPCPRLSLFLSSFHCFYSVCPLVTSAFILANATSVCQPRCLSHGLVLSFDQTCFFLVFSFLVFIQGGGISHVCMIYPPADLPSWSRLEAWTAISTCCALSANNEPPWTGGFNKLFRITTVLGFADKIIQLKICR